jgi:hypothetical protein
MTQFRGASVCLLLLAFAWGCSKPASTDATVASSVPASEVRPPLDLNAGSLANPGTPAQDDSQAEGAFIPPFPENVDYFTPPKVVLPVLTREPEEKPEKPEPQPEPDPVVEVEQAESAPASQPPPPPLRLVGFVEVDGLKALLSVDGQLTVTAKGDSVSNLEVLAVEPPAVVLRHGEEEIRMNMFEQEWFHEPRDRGPLFGSQRASGGRTVTPARAPLRRLPSADARAPAVPGLSELGEPVIPDLREVEDPGIRLPELPQLPVLPGVEGDAADGGDVFDPTPGFAGQ